MEVHNGDILDLDVDVIVNAANTQLQHGGSLAAAIVDAGGSSIQEESDNIGWCDLGSAVATGAGSLSASHIIHVPTVDYTSDRRTATLEEIGRGTRAALELAKSLQAESIAFPLLGAGLAGLKTADVARAMARSIANAEDIACILCVYWGADWEALSFLGEPRTTDRSVPAITKRLKLRHYPPVQRSALVPPRPGSAPTSRRC